jgi:predicted AAA+ superfamily ATPase
VNLHDVHLDMIKRSISSVFRRYMNSFPAVLVSGPRQVGKTTLVRAELKNSHKYILLEDPDQRRLAEEDPKRFLEHSTPPVIYDEFQRVPELSSYLQGLIDSNRQKKGQYILTGSQNFLMLEQISQSLAGRVGILEMYGLSSEELPKEALNVDDSSLGKLMLKGGYPELWQDQNIQPHDWYSSYVQTYIERDVRRLINVGDLASFNRFLRVCAARTAQPLNHSDIASDAGVSPTTSQRWLSLLETTHLIKLVQPYYTNLTSRIRKSPKLYFTDTGLAAYLMGFRDPTALIHSPQYGALFETLTYSNFLKKAANSGEVNEHFYLQTQSRAGVDLIIQRNTELDLVEIKGAKTVSPNLAEQLVKTHKLLGKKVRSCFLASPVEEARKFKHQGSLIQSIPWHQL